MESKKTRKTVHPWIWSIQYQDQISHYFRISIGMAAMIVTFLGVIGAVSLEGALWSLFWGGLLVVGAAWYLIHKRREWLLTIKDPELKRLAHETMLAYIILKNDCRQRVHQGKECNGPIVADKAYYPKRHHDWH